MRNKKIKSDIFSTISKLTILLPMKCCADGVVW